MGIRLYLFRQLGSIHDGPGYKKKQINCYTMVPWGNTFYYFDESEGKEIEITAAPGTKEYAGLWKPLADFVEHLDQKGGAKLPVLPWTNVIL